MTVLIPMLASLALLAAPTDTVFVLGTAERDLTGDGRPEVLRLVAAGKSVDSLDVTFSIMSDRAILYTETTFPLTQRSWGFGDARTRASRVRHRERLAEYADWFFGASKFSSPERFVAELNTAGLNALVPEVIDQYRAEGTPSDTARAISTWQEIQRSDVPIFWYSPGGDRVRAIAWSKRDQRFHQLVECC